MAVQTRARRMAQATADFFNDDYWQDNQQRARRGRFVKRYKPHDEVIKRHRLPDEQDKDVEVRSYRRRS